MIVLLVTLSRHNNDCLQSIMREIWIGHGTIRRLSCAICGSTICVIIHGLYRAQSMDRHNPWIVPCAKHGSTQSMDCTMHKVWTWTACTTVDPRFVPGGRQSIDCTSLPFCHAGFCYGVITNRVKSDQMLKYGY